MTRASWPPDCDRCGSSLAEPGAVVFGPPVLDASSRVPRALSEKHHLCAGCHRAFRSWLRNYGETKVRRSDRWPED